MVTKQMGGRRRRQRSGRVVVRSLTRQPAKKPALNTHVTSVRYRAEEAGRVYSK